MDCEQAPRGNGGRVVWNTYRSLLFQTHDKLPRRVHVFVNSRPSSIPS